jgi:carbonic anhydrase
MIYIIVINVLILIGCSAAAHIDLEIPWGYKHEKNHLSPEHWDDFFTKCHGHRQSPIDIVSNMTQFDESLKPIHLSQEYFGENNGTEIWDMKNNGHSSGPNFIKKSH